MTEAVDVRLSHVTAGYGTRLALTDVSIAVPRGALLAVIGPNGAGKSTLLKLIAGVVKPMAGDVEVLGGVAAGCARRIAYVPQADRVDWAFPVTVEDVVMMGRTARIGPVRRPSTVDDAAVTAALETVRMDGARDLQIGRLSGGQRRRVFLARALAAQPDLYLLDEPLAGVDVTSEAELMAVLAAEVRQGRTVIATTHDLACASARFDQVALVNRRLIAVGPAALAADPVALSATYGHAPATFPTPVAAWPLAGADERGAHTGADVRGA